MSTDAHKYFRKKYGAMTLARAIRACREAEGLTQDSLGKKLGTKRQYICNVESGRKGIDIDQAIHFANALGMSPEYFAELAVSDLLREHRMKLVGSIRRAA